MPKIIGEARKRILTAARAELLRSGYGGLAIRAVAAASGVATGTVYNYFQSKEMLAAAVMLEDWEKAICGMQDACAHAVSLDGGLLGVYESLRAFETFYDRIWSEYAFTGKALNAYRERHTLLISQIGGVLHTLLARFDALEDAYFETFLAESLLTAASEAHDFQAFSALIGRLFAHPSKNL